MTDDTKENDKSEDMEDEDTSSAPSSNMRKLMIMAGVPVIALIGILGALYATGILDGFLKSSDDPEQVEQSAENGQKLEKRQRFVFLEIPDMIVNLSSSDAQTRYLRLSVQIELASERDRAVVEQVMPRVIDQFQTFLRGMRVEDMKGSPGIYRLQKELIARVNTAAYPVEVEDVLFQEILIQ